jgi:hypothetical protein
MERYRFNAYKRTSKGEEMKLTFEQMDEILSKKLIEFCTPSEKRQVMNYAFGEEFMQSKNKGKLKQYNEEQVK